MKSLLPMVALTAAISLPLPAVGGSVHFDYQGCGQPVSLTVVDTGPTEVWRQLASQVGFAVRVGTDAPDTNVDFSMSGPVIEVLASLARYTGAVLVAANDDACLGSRQVRTVWLMSEGTATASSLMSIEASPSAPAPTVDEPVQDQQLGEASDGAVSLSPPQRRGQMTAAERASERERRRQARRAQRNREDDR